MILPIPITANSLLLDAAGWRAGTTWLLSTGFMAALAIALTLVAVRAYEAGVGHVFTLINSNIKPDAMQRMIQRTTTLSGILRSLGKVVILFLGLMIMLSVIGLNMMPILASAGIVGVAVGFGAQSLVKDVITGFFILIEDQYGVGDVIEVNGKTGTVERMNLRVTQLRNLDGQLITIPNGTIALVSNMSNTWARAVLEIGVSFKEDPDRVMAVLGEIGDELLAEMPDQVLEPAEILGMEAIRESDVVIKLCIKTRAMDQWAVARAYRKKIFKRFREEGIEIPLRPKAAAVAPGVDTVAMVILKEA